jgi:hypothetical protein
VTDIPYTIHSETRVTLSPLAKEMATMHGMTFVELAKHILVQERLRNSGQSQREGEN